jgi:hypothetical protein
MQTLKDHAISLAVIGTCVFTGCIEARDPNGQGTSAFISGPPTGSLDYGAGAVGGAGGVSSGGAGGGAGTLGGMSSLPPSPTAGIGGSGGGAGMTVTTGGTGGGGANGGGASGSGGASGASGGTAGMGASGGAGGEAGSTSPSTPGTLTIQFMSVGNDGEYAPRNCGAVWIETSSGAFVKTLERWAGIRAGHLTAWTAASGGWGGGFFFATGGNTADQMDAISAATLRPHQMHTPTWNMKDTMGMVVPDGTYRVMIEVTESERVPSAIASIEFEKGPAPVSLSPSDDGPFKDLTLSYTP